MSTYGHNELRPQQDGPYLVSVLFDCIEYANVENKPDNELAKVIPDLNRGDMGWIFE